jgi:hypothetical protein
MTLGTNGVPVRLQLLNSLVYSYLDESCLDTASIPALYSFVVFTERLVRRIEEMPSKYQMTWPRWYKQHWP